MKRVKFFFLTDYACALRSKYRAALPLRQLLPQGRADVDSQQPSVHSLRLLNTFRDKMEHLERGENGKWLEHSKTQYRSWLVRFSFGLCAPDFEHGVPRSEMAVVLCSTAAPASSRVRRLIRARWCLLSYVSQSVFIPGAHVQKDLTCYLVINLLSIQVSIS